MLFKGKTKEAPKGDAKSQKQSLAIAYRMKRKAHGGMAEDCEHGGPEMCAEGCYAEGGKVKEVEQPELPPVPVADSGMKRYSEGGRVANEDEIGADLLPNEFDDLALRDDLESSYTGANSGDEIGNAGEDERRRSMIDRVMLRRRKQHNPRPA